MRRLILLLVFSAAVSSAAPPQAPCPPQAPPLPPARLTEPPAPPPWQWGYVPGVGHTWYRVIPADRTNSVNPAKAAPGVAAPTFRPARQTAGGFHGDHSCPECGRVQFRVSGPGRRPGTHTHTCSAGHTWWH